MNVKPNPDAVFALEWPCPTGPHLTRQGKHQGTVTVSENPLLSTQSTFGTEALPTHTAAQTLQ